VRGLLYVVILVFAIIMVSRMVNGWRRGAVPTRRTQHDKLVKDPVCNTYIVLSRAVTEEVNGAVAHFCSRECAARFARGDRRRS